MVGLQSNCVGIEVEVGIWDMIYITGRELALEKHKESEDIRAAQNQSTSPIFVLL